ncbi:YitT family protein [Mycoplasma buteonis]|uniref:YitT family protein n=1 Tax=Mycoplasma buteonis TaxID=171280 RepID=UPI00056D382A|nr:YitT family protein [Mycoplasma buteonis]
MELQKKTYTRRRIKSSVLMFGFLYHIQKTWQKLLVITVIAIFMSFAGVLLLQNTGLYALGLEAVGQGIGNLAYFLFEDKTIGYIVFNICFWLIYFILNIPLLVLSYFRISKRFTWFSCYYIAVFTLFGIIFGFIPHIDKVFIFSDLMYKSPDIFIVNEVRIILWDFTADSSKQVAVFLYSLCWGILQGLAAVSVIILSGSTGGFDIFGMYIAKVKLKEIGSVFFILNILSLAFANLIGTYIPASLALNHLQGDLVNSIPAKAWNLNLFFNPNFVSGMLMILANALVVDVLYPKYKLVQTQIYTKNPFELINQINDASNRPFAFSVHTVIGAYSKKETFLITTNTQFLDAAYLFDLSKRLDNNLLICLVDIKKGDGYMFIEE